MIIQGSTNRFIESDSTGFPREISQRALVPPQLKQKKPVQAWSKQSGSESKYRRGIIPGKRSAAAGAAKKIHPSARLFIS